jgi:hypothetical protein
VDLKSVLCQERLVKDVKRFHADMGLAAVTLFRQSQWTGLFLLLCVPPKAQLTASQIDSLCREVDSAVKTGAKVLPVLEELPLSLAERSLVGLNLQFLQNLKAIDWEAFEHTEGSNPPPHYLERISRYATSNSVLLAIKSMWFANHNTGDYAGLLPHTAPVRKGMRLLFGNDGFNPLKATLMQNNLAEEVGLTTFEVNSMLARIWSEAQNLMREKKVDWT